MSDTLDMATRLRNAANAKREKSGKRVKSDAILATVVSFLNNDDKQFEAVETMFPSSTKLSSVVARFRTVISENRLDELVYPVIDADHAYIVKLVEPES